MISIDLKPSKIAAIIIGSLIAIGLIFFGLRIFSSVFTRASDLEPRDVVISDIGQNSAKISWTTGVETQGVLEYGTTPTTLNFFAPETTSTKSHQVELTLLSPNTTYYFQIRISDKKYDNGGVPWTFTTKANQQETIISPTLTPMPTATIAQPEASPTLKDNPNLDGSSEIEVPAPTKPAECTETDCQKIKELLGKGCNTQDYILCILKLTTTPTPSPTPI